MIPFYAVPLAGIHPHRHAHDIRLQEYRRVLDGAVHMGLRREVDHHIRALFLKEPVYCLPVTDALQFCEEQENTQ